MPWPLAEPAIRSTRQCASRVLEILAAPDVVNEYIQLPLLGADAGHEVPHFFGNEVIDPYGYSVTAQRRDLLSGFFDGLGRIPSAARAWFVR